MDDRLLNDAVQAYTTDEEFARAFNRRVNEFVGQRWSEVERQRPYWQKESRKFWDEQRRKRDR